ncbi:MAG: hypothetical protein NVSMB65_00650 [Chloroflexota bacterium]
MVVGVNGRPNSTAQGEATAHPDTSLVRVNLLGPFQVVTPRGPVPDALWRNARARTLFKFLAYRAGTPITRDALLDTLWPGLDPETCQNTVHKAVHLLRQTIEIAFGCEGREVLEYTNGCYLLRSCDVRVDAVEFKRSLFDAKWCEHLGDREGACRKDDVAVGLYSGDLLEDDYLVDWAIPERERLRTDFIAALRRLAAAHAANPNRRAVYLRRLLASEPCAEDAYRGLIEIALASGRRGEALHLYRQCKDIRWREWALGTSAELDGLIAGV